MIYKQINVDAKFPNIPIKDRRIRRLKHDFLHGQILQDRLDDIRAPRPDIFRDALRLNHHALHARIDELLSEVHDLGRVAGAGLFERRSFCVAASAELDP